VLPDSRTELAQPSDVAELVVLQRCCWVQEAIANDTLVVPALHETAGEVADWVAEWTTLVVRQHGRLVGAVRGRQEGMSWQVGRLMVVPDLAGRGVGSALLRIIEEQAPEDVDHFILFTGCRSRRNIRTYERAGYEVTTSAEHVPGHIAGAVFMVKPA
jgi:GNAT superfamily N-acetyltransferase